MIEPFCHTLNPLHTYRRYYERQRDVLLLAFPFRAFTVFHSLVPRTLLTSYIYVMASSTFYIWDSTFLTTSAAQYDLQKLDKATKFLGKAEDELRGKFFYLQFGSKYNRLCHAHIIMRSAIWFELSARGTTLSYVTRKVTQNTRLSFSHMREGLGMRLDRK